MLPPRVAALAIVALVIAAMTGLIVVTGTGALGSGSTQRGVGDASTSRPAAPAGSASRPAPTQTPTSVTSSTTPPATPTRTATSTPVRAATPTPTLTPGPTPAPTPTPTPPAPSAGPNTVAIPSEGVRAAVDDCVVVDRALLPPSDVGRACIWLGGAGLDARSGTTVLVGEAQWVDRGPAAFGRIGELGVGERVVTYGAGRAATRWRIVDVFRRAKIDGVDPNAFVNGRGPRRLYLISAGGRFDGGSFLDNVYVRAVPA